MSDALAAAATTVANTFTPLSQAAMSSSQTPSSTPAGGISPGKSAELCMKNLQQLRYVQQLFKENILSESEFIKQKQMIFGAFDLICGSLHEVLVLCQYCHGRFAVYRRDWLIGACAYRLQQQENMRLLYVCAY